ncbi:MAG TPA: TlpA disulfide reductase family protein [Jatrophihabitans sp.]|jgi:peroxiredoxin
MKPRQIPSKRVVAALIGMIMLLPLAACTGGKNAVDQSAGGQFRYVQANKKGSLIAAGKRKPAGPVAGALVNGGSYQLSADRGKVVILNFLASWCSPCQTETPQYDTIYQQRKASGVNVVGLDIKDPNRSGVQAWLKEKVQVTFPVVFDPTAKTALQLGDVPVVALPGTVLIDKQGRVAAVYTGAQLPADLDPVLDTLSKEA